MTVRRGGRETVWLGLIALTLLRLAVAGVTPLTPDEAYYWVWSRALAPGYLDHPPMVALWVRAGTAVAGEGALGIRLLGPFAALLGSALLWQAGDDLCGRGTGARAAVLLNATLLFGVGSITMTPDAPLLLFWTAALWAMGRLVSTGRAEWWLAAGAACGLAACSKYTAILLPVGIGLWLPWASGQRRWLRHPAPWFAALIAAGLFAPTLWWNARHAWASFAKQGERGFVFHPAAVAGHLGELLGGQAALATPLAFILCVAGVTLAARRAARLRDQGATLIVAFTVPAACVFVEHALGDRVQANWPAIVYPAAAIAAATVWPRLFVPAALLGGAMTALVYVQAAAAPMHLSRHLDPTLRLSGGYAALARDAEDAARRAGASFVALDDYGPASVLAAVAPGCIRLVAIGPRWALFDLPPAAVVMAGRTGLLIRSTRRHDPPDLQDWRSLAPVGMLTRARNGQVAETYTLYRGVGRAGAEPAAVLPCPHHPAVPPD